MTAHPETHFSRACPVCGAQNGQLLRRQSFVLPEGHPLAGGYEVVACSGCGFVFADTDATQADYDHFYNSFSKYDNVATSTGAGASAEDAARLRDTAYQVAAFEPDRSKSLLDIGCATGGLLHELANRGFTQVMGLDPSPASRDYAREHFAIEIVTGSLLEPPLAGPFDGALLCHVLEHVFDVQGAVKKIKGLLRPGGWLYVEVPDAPRYPSYLVAPFQDFNAEHINHFSLQSLDKLLMRYGFVRENQGHKEVLSAPKTPYPAVWGFWRLGAEVGSGTVGSYDSGLVAAIEEYIALSQAMLDEFDARLRQAIEEGGSVIVWGAGQLTIRLLAETCLGEAPIACFIDGNPAQQGKTLRGTPILPPEALQEFAQPIVVASTIHQEAIVARIREELKLDNALVLLRPVT